MDETFFKFEVTPDHFVCLSPLSQEIIDAFGADDFGDDFGYFIYESRGIGSSQCTSILAKCPSYEAASRLIELYTSGIRLKRAA